MSNESPHAFDDCVESPDTDLTNHPLFAVLEQMVDRLGDGLDHPEVWQIIAGASEAEVGDLRQLIAALQALQYDPPVIKIFDILAGVVETVAGDRVQGVGRLQQLEATYALCPQIAGAIFFATRFGDPERSADLSTKFCEDPFIKFETLIDGTVAPCCSIWTQQRLGRLDRQSFEQIWNSPAAQDMRASILDGSFRYCNKQRCTQIMEDRLPERDAIADPELRTIIDQDLTELSISPRWLFLAHDVTCNLSCPSCRDKIIAADEKQEARFEKIERSVFHPLFSREGRVTVSLSGQGDPWSSPHYRSILRYMADHDLDTELNIHTNALLMGPQRWEQYKGLEKYVPLVDVSIDACTPWVYEVVRRPGKWDKLYPNLEFIGRSRAAGTFRAFHLNATIQLDNFHEMPGLVALAETLGADTMRLYMMQNTGGHLAKDYARKNIADNAHPLHLAFLETLRHPALGRETAHLYDTATWRKRSFELSLPSDELGPEFDRETLLNALDGAIGAGAMAKVVALCAAGRIHFPGDPMLLETEARALETLGFPQQAGYRRKEAQAA